MLQEWLTLVAFRLSSSWLNLTCWMESSVERMVLVAKRNSTPIAYLVASPIAARQGYLVELVARSRSAPNGVSELLIDAAMQRLRKRTGFMPRWDWWRWQTRLRTRDSRKSVLAAVADAVCAIACGSVLQL